MSDTWTLKEIWNWLTAHAGEPDADAISERFVDAIDAMEAAATHREMVVRSFVFRADQSQRADVEAASALLALSNTTEALSKTTEDVARAMSDAMALIRTRKPEETGKKP